MHASMSLSVPLLNFFMHSITSEPCKLGFRNFIYGFFMKKIVDTYFFPAGLCSFPQLCPFEKKMWMKSSLQNISKAVEAKALKPGEWIGIDE